MSYDRMSPEFALTAALEAVTDLTGKVSALQPKKDALPPFVFYTPIAARSRRWTARAVCRASPRRSTVWRVPTEACS